MTKRHEPIPKSFPVRLITPGKRAKAKDPMTCGHCGLMWDDAIPTAYTPAPSARCPFEAFHNYLEPTRMAIEREIESHYQAIADLEKRLK